MRLFSKLHNNQIEMSLGGTLSDQHSLTGSMVQKSSHRQEFNLFQKIQILGEQLENVSGKLEKLGEECQSIKQEKDHVEKYLERKSEQNRVRLMGQLDLFETEIKRKIENARTETQKVDQRISQMKQAQLYTLQMILALQRRVHQMQVQLGLEERE